MRLSRNQYFIDESGQFFPREGETGTAVLLLVPDEALELSEVSQLANDWRKRFSQQGKLKCRFIPDDEKLNLARLIMKRRWWVASEKAELGERLDLSMKANTIEAIEITRARLPFAQRADLRIDFLINQIQNLKRDQSCWYMVQNRLLGRVCEVGKREGQCPVGKYFLDNKLPIHADELASFLIRLRLAIEFPEVFGERIASVLGVASSDGLLDVRIRTEEEVDGLVLADVCAATLGVVNRDGDSAPQAARVFRDILTGG